MSINDDLIQPTSDSFWEVGNYKLAVKRVDSGYKLCDSLKSLIDGRNEIEKNYAKQLQSWAKKWNDFLDKGMSLLSYISYHTGKLLKLILFSWLMYMKIYCKNFLHTYNLPVLLVALKGRQPR